MIVDPGATAVAAHDVAARAERAFICAVPRLTAATVHTDPQSQLRPGHEGHLR